MEREYKVSLRFQCDGMIITRVMYGFGTTSGEAIETVKGYVTAECGEKEIIWLSTSATVTGHEKGGKK